MFHVKHARFALAGEHMIIGLGRVNPDQAVMDSLEPEDHLWLWTVTFDGYRIPYQEDYYRVVSAGRRASLESATIHPAEAALREQGRVWDEQRREAYLQRNKRTDGGHVQRDDPTVEYERW